MVDPTDRPVGRVLCLRYGKLKCVSSTALQTSNYPNVPTKRREHCSQEAILTERSQHRKEIAELQRQVGYLA